MKQKHCIGQPLTMLDTLAYTTHDIVRPWLPNPGQLDWPILDSFSFSLLGLRSPCFNLVREGQQWSITGMGRCIPTLVSVVLMVSWSQTLSASNLSSLLNFVLVSHGLTRSLGLCYFVSLSLLFNCALVSHGLLVSVT